MSETPKTVFVTKWALTKGVEEVSLVEIRTFGSKSYAYVRWPGFDTGGSLIGPSHFHYSRQAAVTRAEHMRAAKLKSLEAMEGRMKALQF